MHAVYMVQHLYMCARQRQVQILYTTAIDSYGPDKCLCQEEQRAKSSPHCNNARVVVKNMVC